VTSLSMQLEIDPTNPGDPADKLVDVNSPRLSDHGVILRLEGAEEGHGFGVSEVVTIAVTVATGTTSSLAAAAIKEATKGVIRRARTKKHRSDGSDEGIADLIENERQEPHEEQSASECGEGSGA
jgi:hypothetical protein